MQRSNLGGVQRIEDRSAGRRDDLDLGLPVGPAAEAARKQGLKPCRNGQLGRRERFEQDIERSPLVGAGYGLGDVRLAVRGEEVGGGGSPFTA